MTNSIRSLIAIVLMLLPSFAAQQPRSEVSVQDVSALLEPIRVQEKVPALAAAVIRGGKVIARGAVGVRRAGYNERVTIDDKFHLGSDTKAMTATLMAALVEEGRLSWSTTVGEVFGEALPKMNSAWRTVTLEQLLRHRGGGPADPNPDDMARLRQTFSERNPSLPERRLLVVDAVIARPPAAAPGSQYAYSNIGYVIAGAMAEKITGRAYDELMQEKVFRPLGITSAGFGPPGNADKIDHPWGHGPDGLSISPALPGADNPAFYDPSGRGHMTLGDWASFVSAHLRGDRQNPSHEALLLKPSTYETLHRPIDEYAMGWRVIPPSARSTLPEFSIKPGEIYEGPLLAHGGSNNRWNADVWVFPELDLAILTATNQGGDQAGIHGGGLHNAGLHAIGIAASVLFDKFK
jgi:CubicO group peptidase (beta-lactamase class C family)